MNLVFMNVVSFGVGSRPRLKPVFGSVTVSLIVSLILPSFLYGWVARMARMTRHTGHNG